MQDQLGHATIQLTANAYTSVLPESQREAAEATARLALDASASGEEIRRQLTHTRDGSHPRPTETNPASTRTCHP